VTDVYTDRWITIHSGDLREVLAGLPAESVHAVITSPPYWNLRDYGLPSAVWGGYRDHAHKWTDERFARGPAQDQGETSQRRGRSNVDEQAMRGKSLGRTCQCGAWLGQLGLEPDPDSYVFHLVEAMQAVRRVLRPDGTLWLNIGDSYISTGGERTYGSSDGVTGRGPATARQGRLASLTGLKPKDLAMVPARAAIALQSEGWWLRKDVIWAKPNPMPESITDRPTSSHEHVFLLAKSEIYYYDGDAIREEFVSGADPADWKMADGWATHEGGHGSFHRDGREKGQRRRDYVAARADPSGSDRRPSGWAAADQHGTLNGRYRSKTADDPNARGARQAPEPGERGAFHPLGRNKRDVWAATSDHGVCPKCGGPWRRIVRRQIVEEEAPAATIGWRPTCTCYPRTAEWREIPGQRPTEPDTSYARRIAPTLALQADLMALWAPLDDVIPATVLDPFGGSGTVGLVAQAQQRRAVLVDLNPEYVQMAIARTSREFGVGGKRLRDDGTGKATALVLGDHGVVEDLWSWAAWDEVERAYEGDEDGQGRADPDGIGAGAVAAG
jgi:DNA modification methylase